MQRNFQYGFLENEDYSGCKHFNALANQLLDDFIATVMEYKSETRGRKPKSGKVINFRPSEKVWSILENLPNKTKFIEESILNNNKNAN